MIDTDEIITNFKIDFNRELKDLIKLYPDCSMFFKTVKFTTAKLLTPSILSNDDIYKINYIVQQVIIHDIKLDLLEDDYLFFVDCYFRVIDLALQECIDNELYEICRNINKFLTTKIDK